MGLLMSNRGLINVTDRIPRTGLIAEWLFNGNADDTSGNGYNGTLINSPTSITGFDGSPNSAYNFSSASSQYIQFGNIPELEGVQAFTISKWIKRSINTDMVVGQLPPAYLADKGTGLQYAPDNNLYAVAKNGNAGYKTTGFGVSFNGVWNNLIMTYDGTLSNALKINVYRNGSLVATATTVGTIDSTTNSDGYNFEMGRSFGVNYSNGDIDNVRIYNRVLTTDEILILANE